MTAKGTIHEDVFPCKCHVFFFKCNFPLKMVIFPASHMTFYTGEVVDSTCWRCQCGKKEVVG